MKPIFLGLTALALVCSNALASNKPFIMDFKKIFAKKSNSTYEYNTYEEGCDAVDFIVPAGTRIQTQGVAGARCRVSGVQKLPNGGAVYRIRTDMEIDSDAACRFLVTNAQLKTRSLVKLYCEGT